METETVKEIIVLIQAQIAATYGVPPELGAKTESERIAAMLKEAQLDGERRALLALWGTLADRIES